MFDVYEQAALITLCSAIAALVLIAGVLTWSVWQQDRCHRRHRNSLAVLPAAGQVWKAPTGGRIAVLGAENGSVRLVCSVAGMTTHWTESHARWQARVRTERLWLHRAA